MTKKSFLLVSLKENKAKKLAEVISNNTCRKILDYLAEKKDATESEMANDLRIPISTVHYNMKALMTARLVKCDEYHYSSKGKEVNHYRLANQYVIIAPEGEKHMIREKLKSIIPTALIMGFAASVIKVFSGGFGVAKMDSDAAPLAMQAMKTTAANSVAYGAAEVAEEAAVETAMQAVPAAADGVVREAAPRLMDEAMNTAAPAVQQAVAERAPDVWTGGTAAVSHAPEIALWFLIGAASGVTIYLLVDYIVKKIRDRK